MFDESPAAAVNSAATSPDAGAPRRGRRGSSAQQQRVVTDEDVDPTTAQRRAAALAMVSVWLCSVVGQLLVLWWAKRHGSTFARRYALASLAFEGMTLLALVPVGAALVLSSGGLPLLVFAAAWIFTLVLGVLAIVLAVRAWRGDDVADGPLPRWFTDQLPPQ